MSRIRLPPAIAGWERSRRRPPMLALAVLVTVICVPAEARVYALLVGVSHYPNIDRQWWIEGPANDVELLADVLLSGGFGVRPENVVRLAGWPAEAERRPTRDNIARELERLAEIAGPGDQVVVFLAGHGSQQPADDEAEDLEPDGFDEIFLPADVGRWDGGTGRVAGAITDDEIRAWLTAIRNRGAFVWALIDACHSGTMTRGGGERERQVPPAILGVPGAASPDPSGAARESRHLGLADSAGEIVAMYASQPQETSPERILPWPGGRYHGLFTYTVAAVLRQRRTPLTYRELAAQVAASYRAMDRAQPTPLVEGGGLDREVLGLSEWPQRPRLLLGAKLARRGDYYPLAAGHLAGLSRDTVLTVFPPGGAAEPGRELGHVAVVDIDALRSIVRAVRMVDGGWDPLPPHHRGANFPPGSRCSVHYLSFGDLTMNVALQRGEGAVLAAGSGPAGVEAALATTLGGHGALLRRVGQTAEADWFVRLLDDDVVLVPSSGWSAAGAGGTAVPPAFHLGRASWPAAEIADRLAGALGAIARVHHLLSLETSGGFSDDPLEIDVGIRAYRDRDDHTGVALRWEREGLVLRSGQWVAFEVTNRSRHAVDVTLLFVDGAYGIHPLFPRANASNRLQPEERATPIYRTRVNATTVGRESIVAIAVKADGPPRSFVDLAQPTLEGYRAQRLQRGTRTSALERLLESAAYGSGSTRGLAAVELEDFVVEVLPWETQK